MTMKEREGAATVVDQEGDKVNVEYKGEQMTVPMVGFPPGFQLRRGGHVVLVDQPSGPVARPLVRSAIARGSRENLERRGEIEIEGRLMALQESSVVEETRPGETAHASDEEEYIYWIIESDDTEGPGQVVATRSVRR